MTLQQEASHRPDVTENPVTTADLLQAWREASRAAELAQRLAQQAAQTAAQADLDASAAEEVASLAEKTAAAAVSAADRARAVATEARRVADDERHRRLPEAAAADMEAIEQEGAARDAYHQAERDARDRDGRQGD